ncbi:LysR family transcriptional regulator [Arthrobacter zhangbolii]|uniref:LysR family transcriptional regulator n=1 Tax=Arthrobacter zhangbolii TaxID=2886936 RepID=A0A9X1M6N0_9MICC|nr:MULTISPECIES: LysR family transcriptional regulator [Arthrobacter]MCC3271279.1 LysR family transcriptional regulator [Arthrobacter zhangbolii]MCC3293178.1 LysR family transcriptional regulator [Arthrobacter zhangbolii]MDN3904348.1 LysR family transcriptional regulator [Arthrobacter sp. YD2]UON90935.1 LysR family transcriptional regulator [Arthrobacter zhangbolii]
MVNPIHLKTLLEVLRTGSFAAAALRLGYTASAVSQQMSALERDTGTQLFVRSARTASPTEAAVVMARHAAKVLTDMDALLAAAARTGQDTGHELRLGIFPSLATFALPELLSSPGWQELGISLKLSVAEPAQTIQGLRTGGDLDVALVYQVGQGGLAWPSTISRQWLGDDNFRVVLPESWGIRDGAEVTAEQLAGMPWIMHHPGTPDALVIERLFASCSLHPRVSAWCDDFNASLAMAAAGLGAALVPELAMLNRPAGTVVLDVPEIRLARSIFALLIHEQNVQVRLFLDRLADVLGSRSIVPLPTSGSRDG